jgi:hypothetical protein
MSEPPPEPPAETPPEPPEKALTGFTPVPRQQMRHDGWGPDVQRAFIEFLADTISVSEAARRVGRSAASAYRLRRHPEGAEFAAAWAAARALAIEKIEDFALDRAANGVEVPVFAYGDKIATRRVFSEPLVMFMLQNLAPERYCGEGARGLSALDKRTLERLKQEWREEWEAERERAEAATETGTGDFVEAIQGMHVKWWSQLGPRTRAAYIHFRRLERIEGRAWLDEEADPAAAMAAAEAEYREVFAADGRSRAKLLGEVCSLGDDVTCPEVDEGDDDYFAPGEDGDRKSFLSSPGEGDRPQDGGGGEAE